jgi:Uma2 family endonuclease
MRVSHVRQKPIEYPESDGKPMAESDLHRKWMIWLLDMIAGFFADQRVYVSGNLLIYYEEGNPKKCVAPNLFVVKDCDPGCRRVFKLWEEQRIPCFVLETTSRKTKREDQVKKHELYASLGIPEYFLYDPEGEWLRPVSLVGYRLTDGRYEPVAATADGFPSEQLGLSFRLENGRLIVFDTSTNKRLETSQEQAKRLEAELRALLDKARRN